MEKVESRPSLSADSLLKWLQTFDLERSECSTLQDLSDGVAMAKALHEIAPEWFTDPWLATINVNAAHNWRLKVSNLKKLLKKLMDYYQEYLGIQLSSFDEPNITQIGENSDAEQLGQLLQLVLGCAVNCNNKKEYISKIMGMEEEVQQVIMQSIQDLESCIQELCSSGTMLESSGTGESLSVVTSQLANIQDELRKVTAMRDQMAQRCHELDMQAVLLQEEKTSLQAENKKLQTKLKESEGMEDSTGNSQRFKELKKQIETYKEDIFKAETARDDYRAKLKFVEKEHLELQGKQVELQQAAEEARHLKDELDIVREAADQAAKYEATIESYKKKLEEFSDLKRQAKILEEKNIEYMQMNMELEEEVKKTGTWKPQVEMYKKQVLELHQKLGDETKKVDKVDFENRKLQEKLQALAREKEALQDGQQRLTAERDLLRESNDELRFSQMVPKAGELLAKASEFQDTPTAAESVDIVAPEIKEKLLRLQHENKILKLNQKQDEEEEITAILKAQVEDLRQRIAEDQAQSRLSNQRILELENQLAETHERLGGRENTIECERAGGMKQHLQHLQGQVEQLQTEKEHKLSQLDEKDASLLDYKQKLAFLHDTISRKDLEMQSMEEKYKKCIEKAKSVIKTLDPKQSNGSSPEVADLRNQIQEKDRLIENLEKEYEKNRGIREMEEKLMITAFNKFAVQLHRQAAEQRLSHFSSGQSFLSRQRQPISRRSGHNYNTSEAYLEY